MDNVEYCNTLKFERIRKETSVDRYRILDVFDKVFNCLIE